MSVNRLKTFLTNVADAIRTKTGSTDLINPQDFIQKIENINPDVTISQLDYKDVNFYDYDGTLLYAYTKDEALALEALPKAQKHEGLLFHG
jgi:dTDP-4-dehydrorhamnose reductase